MTNKKITEFTELTAPASTDVLPIIDASDTSNKKISYANLLSKAPDGSTSAPAFSFNSDPNTGISGGSDTLTFSTGGTGRMSISSAGLVNIVGDLTVGGTTTTINTTTLDVEDKNITLGKVSTPTDTTADGGGLTLKGASDKTFNWVNATDSWTSSEHLSVSGQKEVRYLDADSSHYVGFKSPATVSSNVVWTLPSADSSVSGYVLSSNASGVLSWVAPGQNADPNFTGTLTLTDDGNIRGFASTQATYTGSVKTFTVTVATKTAAHRYDGSGSSNGYVIDGKEAPFLTLTPGRTYKFDQSHSSNAGHPLRFYLEANKTTAYTTNVTVNGTAGQSGAYVQIVIADNTPMVIHYQCSSHALMGNAIQTNSATATGTLLSSLSVSGNMDVTGTFTVSDNILMTGTGAIDVASGTTAQRPGSPSAGMFRFNSQTSEFEGYDGSAWGEIGGAAATGTADLLDIASSSGTGGGSATFNGSAYRFKLVTKGTSNAVTPSNAEILRVSINGVMQQPNDGSGQGDMTDGYVVSGTDIIFDSAPPSGSTYFIINMGATIAIGTPGDNTVTSAKIVDGTIVNVDISSSAAIARTKLANVDVVDDTSPQLGGNLDTNDKNIVFGDSDGGSGTDNRAVFGANEDLKIYHDGTSSYIVNTTNDLIIWDDSRIRFRSPQYMFNNAANDENIIIANENGAVELYHNNSKKIETTAQGINITGNARSSITTLTDGANITVDLSSASHFTVTLGGNRTFVNSGMNTSNAIGSSGSIFIVQDGTGGRSGTFESAYKFPGGTAPTLSTAANAVDRIDYIVRAADNVHCVVTLDVK